MQLYGFQLEQPHKHNFGDEVQFKEQV